MGNCPSRHFDIEDTEYTYTSKWARFASVQIRIAYSRRLWAALGQHLKEINIKVPTSDFSSSKNVCTCLMCANRLGVQRPVQEAASFEEIHALALTEAPSPFRCAADSASAPAGCRAD
eukprot:4109870-Karenia_brevis.AAC.1